MYDFCGGAPRFCGGGGGGGGTPPLQAPHSYAPALRSLQNEYGIMAWRYNNNNNIDLYSA